jgi:GntR family transcriptional repressor for pyruvate dehydrogenase complex
MLKRNSLARDVEQVLLQRIAKGVYRVGDRLPTERELAESLGVSRGSVREALSRLHSMGLTRIVRGRGGGWFVEVPDSATLSHALSLMLMVKGVTNAALVEARIILAPPIAALAAERATAEDIAELEALCDVYEADSHSDAAHRAHVAFHVKLAEACGNPILQAAMIPLLDLVDTVANLARIARREGQEPPFSTLLRGVVDAIKARDPDRARSLMTKQVEAFADMLTSLEISPPWLAYRDMDPPAE